MGSVNAGQEVSTFVGNEQGKSSRNEQELNKKRREGEKPANEKWEQKEKRAAPQRLGLSADRDDSHVRMSV